jgi:spermidine synthase
MIQWLTEPSDDGIRLQLAVRRTLHRARTQFQEIEIVESATFGRVLLLDGVVQTTERDEFIYHEMLTHVPLLSHGAVRRVLIAGGGDCGALREVLKHPVEAVTMVEIDPAVVRAAREFLPSIGLHALDDPRTELVFADAAAYVVNCGRRFDVIIVDSTDPDDRIHGPGAALSTRAFYLDCYRALNPAGILIAQQGMPALRKPHATDPLTHLGSIFPEAASYIIALPSYVGGYLAIGWGAMESVLSKVTVDILRLRLLRADLETRCYTPEFHLAAFALPRFLSAREPIATN